MVQVLTPTSYLMRDYRKNNATAQLFVVFYALQRAGETMHSPKACLPGAGWEFTQKGMRIVNVGPGKVACQQRHDPESRKPNVAGLLVPVGRQDHR